MGAFVNLIRKKLGLEPKRDKTLTGGIPNEVVLNRSLEEAVTHNPVVFAPARMNPPTPAHRLIVDTALNAANEFNAPHHIILTRSHDVVKKKTGAGIRNPLTPEQKIKHAKRFFPDANVKLADKDKPNLLSQLSDLHHQGHDHLVMVAGSDRIPEYKRLIDTYNGKSGPHGHFNFKKITYRSAGERDPEVEGQAGWSATKSRQTAEGGDMDKFKKNAVPKHISDDHAKELYHDLRGGMGLHEDVGFNMAGGSVPAVPTRSARDIQGKKSPLTNTPPPGPKGNIGYDSDITGNETELSRRRAKKRLFSIGYLEGYDTSSDMDVRPNATPVVNAAIPSVRPKFKTFKQMKEGQFTDVPGEQGSPTYGSDVDNSSNSTDIRSDDEDKDYRGDLLKRGTRVLIHKHGYEGLKGNIDSYDVHNKSYVVSIDHNGSNLTVDTDDVEPLQESKNKPYVKPFFDNPSQPTKQTGWKASNKHGKVKYFRLEFKNSAKRHAGLDSKSLTEEVKAIMERGEDSKGYYRSTESGAGLTKKGAAHFGIKTAVTRKNVDPDSEAGKRRKSFCARMSGMKGPMKDEKGRPTRKAMSLRRWRCGE